MPDQAQALIDSADRWVQTLSHASDEQLATVCQQFVMRSERDRRTSGIVEPLTQLELETLIELQGIIECISNGLLAVVARTNRGGLFPFKFRRRGEINFVA
jgi:hypothetical protein